MVAGRPGRCQGLFRRGLAAVALPARDLAHASSAGRRSAAAGHGADFDMTIAAICRDGSAPLYELIYAVLREHLLDGSFPAGLVLGKSAVARAFRSSRTPAVAALAAPARGGPDPGFRWLGLSRRPGAAAPIRRKLADAGLRLPPEIAASLKVRSRHGRIYPDVEHAVAACLAYGRFLLNESALAEHYDVSRTVAHEVLTRMERTGLIPQDVNKRWYAGPLTAERLSEHFEMRWLLEPAALGQAMDRLDRDFHREPSQPPRRGATPSAEARQPRAPRNRPACRHGSRLQQRRASRCDPPEPAPPHRHPLDLRPPELSRRDRADARRAPRRSSIISLPAGRGGRWRRSRPTSAARSSRMSTA